LAGEIEDRHWTNIKLADTFIRSLPKVLLHDHLDGGLRPQTAIELARDQHYKALPTTDAGELAECCRCTWKGSRTRVV
jgi:adenosine deaminase